MKKCIKRYKRKGYKKKGIWGSGFELIRLKALKRDKYTCQLCGVKANEIHHKDETGSNRLIKEQNNKLENLITLCRKCHCNHHLINSHKNGFCFGKNFEEVKRNKQIYKLSLKISQVEIGRKYGITRQRVNQIIKRNKLNSINLNN